MKRQAFAWLTLVPAAWLVVCTVSAGLEKVFHSSPKIGFLAHAHMLGDALAQGKVIAPAKTMAQMHQMIFNDYVDAARATPSATAASAAARKRVTEARRFADDSGERPVYARLS